MACLFQPPTRMIIIGLAVIGALTMAGCHNEARYKAKDVSPTVMCLPQGEATHWWPARFDGTCHVEDAKRLDRFGPQ